MNNQFAPTFIKPLGFSYMLWYEVSNSYSIIEPEFHLLLESYLDANSEKTFFNMLSGDISDLDAKEISQKLYHYLENCNRPRAKTPLPNINLDTSLRHIAKVYNFKGQTVQVFYDSAAVVKLIHPALAHYCQDIETDETTDIFDIHFKNEQLLLFKNKRLITFASKQNYHLIQGKFIMHLFCALYHKEEKDWIGTFHGSTMTDENSAILFIGKSGKGKSTLCTLLSKNGFKLLADDVSPMLSENEHIYHNPSATSIKEGAFELLKPIVHNFDYLPLIKFNTSKGNLKYVPALKPKKAHYPCKAVVLVNYTPQSKTKLTPVSAKTILETLIPDSWLSPLPKHAKQFLEWFSQLELYELTYSDTTSVTSEVSQLFEALNLKP